jgi:dsRNA-specific ribonuclease
VKRSVSLSARADGLVLSAMQAEETYSQTLERLICATIQRVGSNEAVTQLVATLSSSREPVAVIYRRLGWTRQEFERLVQAHREELGRAGVRLHVATKEAASGRREQYITVDGMRYSALSHDGSGW